LQNLVCSAFHRAPEVHTAVPFAPVVQVQAGQCSLDVCSRLIRWSICAQFGLQARQYTVRTCLSGRQMDLPDRNPAVIGWREIASRSDQLSAPEHPRVMEQHLGPILGPRLAYSCGWRELKAADHRLCLGDRLVNLPSWLRTCVGPRDIGRVKVCTSHGCNISAITAYQMNPKTRVVGCLMITSCTPVRVYVSLSSYRCTAPDHPRSTACCRDCSVLSTGRPCGFPSSADQQELKDNGMRADATWMGCHEHWRQSFWGFVRLERF
jgi:hypothetical protein